MIASMAGDRELTRDDARRMLEQLDLPVSDAAIDYMLTRMQVARAMEQPIPTFNATRGGIEYTRSETFAAPRPRRWLLRRWDQLRGERA